LVAVLQESSTKARQKRLQAGPASAAFFNIDVFAKTLTMAKPKFRPTRLGGFSGTKAYIKYVEILKKRRNAVGRTFCDANG